MDKVKVLTDSVIVRFNDKFYDKAFIEQALRDFESVCTSDEKDGELILTPKNPNDLEVLGFEFYNYVLGLMKNQ